MVCCWRCKELDDEDDDQVEPIFKTVRHRWCTDVACLCFLFLSIIIMLSIAVFSLTNGDINYILYPVDYLGQVRPYASTPDARRFMHTTAPAIRPSQLSAPHAVVQFCGHSPRVSHLPKVFFPQLDEDIKTFLPLLVTSPTALATFRPYALCVAECPTIFSLANPQPFGGPLYPGAATSNRSSTTFYNLRGSEAALNYCLPTTKLSPANNRLLCGLPVCDNQTMLSAMAAEGLTTTCTSIPSTPEVTTAWVIDVPAKEKYCDFVVKVRARLRPARHHSPELAHASLPAQGPSAHAANTCVVHACTAD